MPRKGTIDSITVGLGIDTAQLDRDLKGFRGNLQKEVQITPRINAPGTDAIDKFRTSLQASVARKGIKVPLDFDKDLAINNYEAAIKAVEGKVRPITVPVHFRKEADATSPSPDDFDDETGPSGGGPSTGPRGGGGGKRGGKSKSAPTKGAASSTAVSGDDIRVADLEKQVETMEAMVAKLSGVEKATAQTAKAADKGEDGKSKSTKGHSQKTTAAKGKTKKASGRAPGVIAHDSRFEDSTTDERDYGTPPEEPEEEEAAPTQPRAKAKARTTGPRKPAAAQPLQVVDPAPVSGEERQAARAAAKGRATAEPVAPAEPEAPAGPNVGHRRTSRPARTLMFDKAERRWKGIGPSVPDDAGTTATGNDRGIIQHPGLIDALEGKTFGSVEELRETVINAAQQQMSGQIVPLEPGERNRRFYNLSPFEREQRLDEERAKGRTILSAISELETATEKSRRPGITQKQRGIYESQIQRAYQTLEDIAPGVDGEPGLGGAISERNAGKARAALLRTRGIKTKQGLNRELSKQKRRFWEGSRSDISNAMEDYPAEFALDAVVSSLYEPPVEQKAGGPTARAQGLGPRSKASSDPRKPLRKKKDELARAPYPKEAYETVRRIEGLREARLTAPDEYDGFDAEAETDEYDKASDLIKAYDKSKAKAAQIQIPPSDSKPRTTPPPAESVTAAIKEAETRRSAAQGLEARISALPLDYGETVYGARESFGATERPYDIETGKPITTSMAERLKKDEIVPAKGLPPVPGVAAAYARLGTPESRSEAEEYLRRQQRGFARGGFMDRLFGRKEQPGLRYPRYDVPGEEFQSAVSGTDILARHPKGEPMSPWVRKAAFKELGDKDLTGYALGGNVHWVGDDDDDPDWKNIPDYSAVDFGEEEARHERWKRSSIGKQVLGEIKKKKLGETVPFRPAGDSRRHAVDPRARRDVLDATRTIPVLPQAREPFYFEKNAMGGPLQQRLMAAKIQQAYDTGNIAEGQRLQLELEGMKGGWGEPEVQLPMSPFMQLLKAKRLPGKDMTGMAMGGYATGGIFDGEEVSENNELGLRLRTRKGLWTTDPEPLFVPEHMRSKKFKRALADTEGDRGIYHVTTDLAGVMDKGLLSAFELSEAGKDRAGLGSGGSAEVSTTWSLARAKRIREVLEVAGMAARGEIFPDDILDTYSDSFTNERDAKVRLGHAYGAKPGYTKLPLADLVNDTAERLMNQGDDLGQANWRLMTLLDQVSFEQANPYQPWTERLKEKQLPDPTRKGVYFFGVGRGDAARIEPENIGLLELAGRSHQPLDDVYHPGGPRIIPHEYEMRFPSMDLQYRGQLAMGLAGHRGRSSSLSDLPDIAANAVGITEVGEQGREAIVQMRDGGSFVVPNHQLQPFKKMIGMADGGAGDFEMFDTTVSGMPQRFIRPRAESIGSLPFGNSRMTFADVEYGDRGASGGYREGRDPKIHVAATQDEALQTLELVNKLAKEMQVPFKYVPRMGELAPTSKREHAIDGTFGPGGTQQGKFITAYPPPAEAADFADRLDAALRESGVGKLAAVAPSEIQYAPDTPMTHRSSAGERYGALGGYGPGAPDLIGTRNARHAAAGSASPPPPPPPPRSTPPPPATPGWDAAFGSGRRGGIETGAHMANPGVRYDRSAPPPPTGPWSWAPMGDVPIPPPPAPPLTNRGVGEKGLRIMDSPGATFATRRGVADVRALESGDAATLSTMSNDIQRVYVVNMPTSGFGARAGEEETPATEAAKAAGGGIVAAPVRGGVRTPAASAGPSAAPPGAGGGDPLRGGTTFGPGLKRGSAEGSMAKFRAEDTTQDLQDTLDQVGVNISEALQKSPVRALSVAFGQIAQTVIGGRAGILERAAGARALGRKAGTAVQELRGAEEQRDLYELQMERDTGASTRAEQKAFGATLDPDSDERKKFDELLGALENAEERVQSTRPIAERRASEAKAASENILTGGQQIRSQAVGLVGITAGTLAFTAAMHAAQMAVSLMSDVATKAADQVDGFGFTARRTAAVFADAITAASGDIKGAVSGIAARAGVPTGTDLSALSDQAGRLAGARQFQEQRDLLRSQDYFAGKAGQAHVAGLGIGFNDGLFGTFIGQQQGAAELLAGRLQGVPLPTSFAGKRMQQIGVAHEIPADEFAQTPDDYRAQLIGMGSPPSGGVFNYPVAPSEEAFAEALSRTPAEIGAMPIDEIEKLILAGRPTEVFAPPRESDLEARFFERERPVSHGGSGMGPVLTALTPEYLEHLEQEKVIKGDLTKITDDMNASLEKAGSNFKWVLDPARAEEFRDVLTSVGAGSYAGAYADRGVVLQGPSGELAGGYDTNRAFAAQLQSALEPTLSGLLEEMERPFGAQLRAIERDAQLQMSQVPVAAAQSLIANPFPQRTLTGVTATSGVDPQAAAAAAKYEGAIAGARNELAAIRDEGLTELRNLGVPQKAIDDVMELGQAIVDLRSKAENLQLGLEQAQYNEQIRLSARGISDLVALNQKQAVSIGDQVIGASKLGALQRAQINDSRELTQLQLARSQREINFALAISKLRSPGETPEERAVRGREAELLARDQQKELDITKRSSGRGFQIQDIELARQLEDAVKQYGLLQHARSVAIEVRGIQQVIAAKEQLLQVKQAFIEIPKNAGLAVIRAGHQVISQLEARLGAFTEAQYKEVQKYVKQVNRAWSGLVPPDDGTGGGSGSGKSSGSGRDSGGSGGGGTGKQVPRASGGIDLVSSPTNFLAGEAGTEAVIVLRNPKSMGAPTGASIGGGGGGRPPITISVNVNAEVRGEADEDRMVRKVVRALHDEVALLVG